MATLTEAEKKARAAEHARLYRERLKKGTNPRAGKADDVKPDAPKLTGAIGSGGTLASLMQDAERRIQERTKAMVLQTIEGRMADNSQNPSMTEIMSTFAATAGQDPESEALIRFFAVLKSAERMRVAIADGNFSAVIGKPEPSGKRKRA